MKKKQTKEWQVEWLPIDGLKPYENNPREIEAAIPLVAAWSSSAHALICA
jgi:hypothetical protein